jgi:type IV secretion system protein VirD4
MEFLIEIVLGLVALGIASHLHTGAKKCEAWKQARNFEVSEIYGSGTGFASDADCEKGGLFGWKGIRLGFSKESGREFRFNQDTHLTLIGPTGSAKTSSFLMPNIIGLDGAFGFGGTSKLITDSKGSEITLVAGSHLATQGPYYAFAPYGLGGPVPDGVKIARYNPMAPLLDAKTPKNRHEAIARRVADGCISGEAIGRDSFFVNGGRELFSTWILAVAKYGPVASRNLPGVVRLMKEDFEGFCKRIVATRDRELAPRFKAYLREMERESRSFADILQTVYVETSFLLDPAIAESLSGSDFRFEWLGALLMTIAICLPLDLVEVNGKLCRLLVACCLGELLTPDRPHRKKIVMFCDEAASYGPLECLVNAYSTARAFGVRIWTVWTDIGAMEQLYPKRYLSLLANSGAQIWLGTKEPKSAEHMSRQSGFRDVMTQSRSINYQRDGWPGVSDQQGQARREVLMIQEAQNLPVDEALLWVRGISGVIRCKHRRYFDQWRFLFRYRKNPLYRKH